MAVVVTGSEIPHVGSTVLDEVKVGRMYLLGELSGLQAAGAPVTETTQLGTNKVFGRLVAITSGTVAPTSAATVKIDAAANGKVRIFLTVLGDANGPLLNLVDGGYKVELFTTNNGQASGTPNAALALSSIKFLYVPHLSAVFTSAVADNLYVGGSRVQYGTAVGATENGGRITSAGLAGTDAMYYNTDEVDLLYVKVSGGTGSYPSFAILEEDNDAKTDFVKIEAVKGAAQAPYVQDQVALPAEFRINMANYYNGATVVLTKGGVATNATVSAYNSATGVLSFTAVGGAYTPDANTTADVVGYFKISKTNAGYTTTGTDAQNAKVMIYDSAARILGDGVTDGILLPLKIKNAPVADAAGFYNYANAGSVTTVGDVKYWEHANTNVGGSMFSFKIDDSNYYTASETSSVSITTSITLPSDEFTQTATNHNIDFLLKSEKNTHAFGTVATADPKAEANVRTFAAGDVAVNYSNTTVKRTLTLNTNQTLKVGVYEDIEFETAPVVRVATTAPNANGGYVFSNTFYADNNKVYANEVQDSDASQVYIVLSNIVKGLGSAQILSADFGKDGGASAELKNAETEAHGLALTPILVTESDKTMQLRVASSALGAGSVNRTSITIQDTLAPGSSPAGKFIIANSVETVEGFNTLTAGTALPASFTATLPVEQLTTSHKIVSLGNTGSASTLNINVQNFVGAATVSGAATKTGLTLNGAAQTPSSADALYSAGADVGTVGVYGDGVQDIVINETITVTDARGRSVVLTYANGASCTIRMVRSLSFNAGVSSANVTRVTLTAAQLQGNQSIPFLTYVYNGGAVVDGAAPLDANGYRKPISVQVFPDTTTATVAPHLTFSHTQTSANNTNVVCSLAYTGPVQTNQIMRAVFSFGAIDGENSARLTQISTTTKFFYFTGALPSVRFRELTSGFGHHVQNNRPAGFGNTGTVQAVDNVNKVVTLIGSVPANQYVGMEFKIGGVSFGTVKTMTGSGTASKVQLASSVNLTGGLVGQAFEAVVESVHRFNTTGNPNKAICEAVFNEDLDTIGYFDSSGDNNLGTDDTSGIAITASTASDSSLDIINPITGDVLSGNVTPTSTSEGVTAVAAGTSVNNGVLTLTVATPGYFTSDDAYVAGVWERKMQLADGVSFTINTVVSGTTVTSLENTFTHVPVNALSPCSKVAQKKVTLAVKASNLGAPSTGGIPKTFTTADLSFAQKVQLGADVDAGVGVDLRVVEVFNGNNSTNEAVTTSTSVAALTVQNPLLNIKYVGFEDASNDGLSFEGLSLVPADFNLAGITKGLYEEDVYYNEVAYQSSRLATVHKFSHWDETIEGEQEVLRVNLAVNQGAIVPEAAAWLKENNAGTAYESQALVPLSPHLASNSGLTLAAPVTTADNQLTIVQDATAINDKLAANIIVYSTTTLTVVGTVDSVAGQTVTLQAASAVALNAGDSLFVATQWTVGLVERAYNVLALPIAMVASAYVTTNPKTNFSVMMNPTGNNPDGRQDVDARTEYAFISHANAVVAGPFSDTTYSPVAANHTVHVNEKTRKDGLSIRSHTMIVPNTQASATPVASWAQLPNTTLSNVASLHTTYHNTHHAVGYNNIALAYVGDNLSQANPSASMGGDPPMTITLGTVPQINSTNVATTVEGTHSVDHHTGVASTADQINTNFGSGVGQTTIDTAVVSVPGTYTVPFTFTAERAFDNESTTISDDSSFLITANEVISMTTPYPASTDSFASVANNYYIPADGGAGDNIVVTLLNGNAKLINESQLGSDPFDASLTFDSLSATAYVLTENSAFNTNIALSFDQAMTVTSQTSAQVNLNTLSQDTFNNSTNTKLARNVRQSVVVMVSENANALNGGVADRAASQYPGWVPASKLHTGLHADTIGPVYNSISKKDLAFYLGGSVDLGGAFSVTRSVTAGSATFSGTTAEISVSGNVAEAATLNFRAMAGATTAYTHGGQFPIVGCYYDHNGALRSKNDLSDFLVNSASTVYSANELRSRVGFKLPGSGNNGAGNYSMSFSANLPLGNIPMTGSSSGRAGNGIFDPYFLDANGNELASHVLTVNSVNQSSNQVTLALGGNSTYAANHFVGFTLVVVFGSGSSEFFRTVSASTAVNNGNTVTLTLLGGWEVDGNATNGYSIAASDTVCLTNTRDGYDPATDSYRVSWKFNSNVQSYLNGSFTALMEVSINDYANSSATRIYSSVKLEGVADDWTISADSSFGNRSASFGQSMSSTLNAKTQWLSNRYLQKLVGVTPQYDEDHFRSFSQTKEEKRVFATNALVDYGGSSPKAGNVMRVLGIRDVSGLSNENFTSIFSALSTLGGQNSAATGDFSTKAVGEAMGTGVLADVYPTNDLTVSISMVDNTQTFPDTQAGNNGQVLFTASAVDGKIANIKGGENGNFTLNVKLNDSIVSHTQFDTKDANGDPTGCYAIVVRGNSDAGANYVRLTLLNIGAVQSLEPLTLDTTNSWADRCVFSNGIGAPTVDTNLFTAANGPYDAQLWVREAAYNNTPAWTPSDSFSLVDTVTNKTWDQVRAFLSTAVPMRVSAESQFPSTVVSTSASSTLLEYMYRVRLSTVATKLSGGLEDTLVANLTDGLSLDDGFVQSPIFKGFGADGAAFRTSLAIATRPDIMGALDGSLLSMRASYDGATVRMTNLVQWTYNASISGNARNLSEARAGSSTL